jgi:NitT/TauT family transport system substrate-binding protein
MKRAETHTGLRASRLATAVLALGCALPASAETITVTHWGAAFYGAPYAVAMEKGFFKQRGVDITGVLTTTGGGTSVRNTLAADLPFGEVALSAAIEAFQAGQPIKIVCAGVDSMADLVWVAKPDSPMNSIKDIVGKKIGYTSPGSVSNMLIVMAMRAQGIDSSQVSMVPIGGFGANLAAVLNGTIDAGIIAEPLFSQAKSKIKPVFWTNDVLRPNIMDTVGIVTDEFARTQPGKIRAIIEGRREAVRFIRAHPDDAAEIVAETYNIDPAVTREVFRRFVAIGYWSEGALDYAAMEPIVEGLRIVGKLKAPMDWRKATETSFLPLDLQAKMH